jgi:hypothetical protein
MVRNHSEENSSKRRGGIPLLAAIVIAVFGVLSMLIVDHGPWNKPKAQTAAVANYTTTGDAARAVGAAVTRSEPKLQVEPTAPGPRPVHPATPATP